LQQAIVYFADADNCLNYMVSRRWPNGVVCPTCGRTDVSFLANQRKWQCKSVHPRRQFSVKIGTIFEDSPLGLDKWLMAVWMITNCKNGVSSYEIHRAIKVTQKTAWFMLHRIRLAMQTGSFEKKMSGEIEADETFIGGKARNMHLEARKRRITGTGGKDKVTVMGILERGGTVRLKVVPDTKKETLQGEIRFHVTPGAEVFTDQNPSYKGLLPEYFHASVNHAADEYVRGRVHTQGIDNFWSLLKRGLNGTYVSVEPFHLFRYLDEQAFRFNYRKDLKDGDRFSIIASQVAGKRLTYKELTSKLADDDKISC
jgi:transposase-like protein